MLTKSINTSTIALGGFIAVAAGIAGAIALFDHLNISADESREALSNMQSDYDDTKSNIESLNSELETTRDRIDELNAKENLSLVEQEELSKLQTQNAELERTLELEEARAKIEARKLVNQAKETYNEWTTEDGLFANSNVSNAYDASKVKQYKNNALKIQSDRIDFTKYNAIHFLDKGFDNFGLEDHDYGTFKDNINQLIGSYEALKIEMQNVKEAQDELSSDGLTDDEIKQVDALQNYYDKLEGKTIEVQGYMTDYADVMQEIMTAYESGKSAGINVSDLETEYKEAKAFLTEYMKMYTGASEVEGGINTLFSKAAFVGVKDELIKAGETSREVLDGIIEKTPGLTQALDAAGVSAQQLGDYIMAIADPDALRIDEIKAQLFDDFKQDLDDGLTYEVKLHAIDEENSIWNDFISGKTDEEIEIFYRYVNSNDIDISGFSADDLQNTFNEASKNNTVELEGVVSKVDVAKEALEKINLEISEKDALSETRIAEYDASGKDYDDNFYKERISESLEKQKLLKDAQNEALNVLNGLKNSDEATEEEISEATTNWFNARTAYWQEVSKGKEYQDALDNLAINKLQSQMTTLQESAQKVQDDLSLKEAKGVKPLVSDYQKLIKNSNQQVKNLQDQNAELRNQQTALKNLGLDETSTAYQEIESQINANVSSINQARISQLEWNKTVDSLRYEPNEGLIAYNTAKSTRNAGDNYLDMLNAAKEAQKAYNKGLVGTDDFKTVAEMFSPNGMDDASNWKENYGNITRYFTEDVTGVKNALNDLEDANLATQDSMGNWTYSIDDVQKSADTLGISFEAFLAIMGRLQDYGFSNDFFSSVEEGQEHISDLYTELTDAEQKMQELKKARDDGDTTVTDTVLASQEARVNQIKQSILESQDLLAQLASKDAQTYQAEQNAKIQSVLTMAKTSQQLDEQYVQGYLSNIQDTIEENGLEVDLKDLITINDDGSLAINWEEYLRLENQVGIPLEVTTEFKDAQVEEIKTKLTSAMEDGTSEVQSFVDTIAQYSSEQLGSITFGDGSYGEFEDAERAIDGLLSSLGLSQSEAQTLLTILAEMGKIEYTPEVSTEGVVEETQGAISEAQSTAAENPVVIPTEVETSGETTTVEGGTATVNIEGNNEGAKQSATEAKEFADAQSSEVNVGADTSGAYDDVNKLIENVSHRFVDINVGANTSGLTTDINNALSGTRIINVHANVTVSTASGGVALGTAHANGTVLDMWNNYRASIGAYAKGNNWALPRNETALVNETGNESIVRNGRWFEIPGNAHVEQLKRGDIIFNATQTEELKKYGRVLSGGGHGRVALADGTAYNMLNAYGNGTAYNGISAYANNSGSFQGGAATSSSIPSTKSTASSVQKAVSTAAKSLTKTAKSIADWAKDLFDHIEIKLDNLEKKASSYYDKAQLYIDKGLDSAKNYKNAEKYLQNAINTVNEQINYNKQGEVRYALQAEAAYQQSLKKLNKKNDKTFKSAVSTIKSGGTIDISSYNEKVREAIEEFQKWYDKSQDCKYAIDDLNATLEEYSDELYNLPLEQASAKIEKLSASMDVLNSKTSVATTGGSSIENFADVLDANVSSAQSSLKSANSNVSSKQTAYNKAKSAYNSAVAKENETEATLKSATKTVKKYGGKLGKKRLKQITNGEIISTKGLKGKALTAAKAYNKAVQANDKAEAVTASAKTAYTNATNALNNAKTAKAQIDAYYNELKKQQEEIRKYENKASYEYANYLAKQGLNNTAQQHQANLSALSQAEANVTTASNIQKSTANAVTSKANSILNSKYASKLTTAQKNALKAGKSVSTSGVTNKTLLKYLNDYNAKVQAATSAANNLTNAQETLTTAQQNATTSAAELASARTEYAKQTFENIQNYYNAVSDYRKTLADQYSIDRSLKEAYGKDLNTSDFQNEIGQLQSQRSLLVEERSKLESQLNSLVSQGYIKQNTEEWYEMKSQIVEIGNEIDNLDMSVMELQDTMREEVFYQALNKALETAEKLRGSILTIKDIISDEMMFDDDGKLTDFGITALAMDIKEYESNIDSLGTLLKKRDQYIKDFNNGNNSTNYSQKEFNEDMDTITSEIQNMLKDTNSVRQAIIDTIVKQGEVELEAVNKVIDAREKLLQKQKDYYDYDKTLKSQTKDLKLLEQQISALDGMTDAESRAQKARLEAQRQEKQDELDETVRDHVFDLQVQGLDDLKVELQENYDNYVKDLNNNLDTIVSTVKNTTASINGTLNTVNETVKKILNSYGVSGLDITDIGLPKYATGTKYVKKSGWAITQEKGGELILKDGSVLTPLKAGDGVIPNKLTEDLFDLASNYDKIMDNIQQPRIYCPEVIVPDLKGDRQTISPTVECPINIYGNNINEQDVVKAIRKSIPEISKTVQNDIRKDLKKSGR